MTSCYDVIKEFDFSSNFDVTLHYEIFVFVNNPQYMLNYIVYAFKMFKQNAIIFFGSPTKILLKISLFSRKIAIFKIYDDVSKKWLPF